MLIKIFNLILIDYLNYLIRKELWVHKSLLKHKGKIIKFVINDHNFFLKINNQGFFNKQYLNQEVDLLLKISFNESLLNFALKVYHIINNKVNYNKILHISGDASLAKTILFLMQNLNFNIINEMIETCDDVYFLFIINFFKTMHIELNKIIYNFFCNITEFLTEESNLLISYPRLHTIKNDTNHISNKIYELQNNINALNKRIKNNNY
ncbi:hypothetical protein CKSOR_00061 [Candidatus Kinetoplastibacterium sorsogonicusi]|uniref:SCP2 domain-containing protein n=1 Tax=Candidatus Kinetoplastidibacterium kentomonadis TaxID=1576550 RepID=A0A3Q8EXY2_9PROT|nr:hypothetical protein [Candidatus Kinetoplastibacterium sorsogonicusi]AWD32205.1 hypothetical protein CKSOR_00061 [Candidatus Kinetoplastibacterium sorsogonicusi]